VDLTFPLATLHLEIQSQIEIPGSNTNVITAILPIKLSLLLH
jgi:hypothetical protein